MKSRLEILEAYHKHLSANARMYSVAIGSWDFYKKKSIKYIEQSLKSTYNEINAMQSRASKMISILTKGDYNMSSLKSIEQWYRENQLSDLLD